MTQHQLLFIQIQFVKQEPHNIYIIHYDKKVPFNINI